VGIQIQQGDYGEWSASCPSRFITVEIDPGVQCIGSWENLQASLHISEKRKMFAPAKIQTPQHQAIILYFVDRASRCNSG
jgi:hypothetical protein